MDPRWLTTSALNEPSGEERSRPVFWRVLPRAGRFAIFDRSWYGRVLVEGVEGFANMPSGRRQHCDAGSGKG